MRIIIKPAGALLLSGLCIVSITLFILGRAQAGLRTSPVTAPIAGFHSARKGTGGGAPIFDSRDALLPVNLTDIGTRDWLHWGRDGNRSVTRKNQSKHFLGNVELLVPKSGRLPEGQRGPSRGIVWEDGSPMRSTPVTYSAIHVGANNGFRFTVPADATDQTLLVYVGGWKAGGDFSVWMSDGTTPVVEKEEIALGSGYYSRTYKVRFRASSSGQELKVVWKMNRGEGNISLQAAALR